MTTGELLNNIATHAGIDMNDAGLKSLLMNAELAKIPVPDDLSTKINDHFKELMGLETAKQNPILKNHFIALALNGIDTELERTSKELGISEEDIKAVYASEKSTSKRLSTIAKKIQELESKKNADPDGKKHEGLNKQIADLNAKIVSITEETNKKLAEEKNNFHSKLKDYKYNEKLQNKDYTENIPKEVQLITARNVLDNALTKKQLTVSFDPETGNLRLRTNADTDYFENNKLVSLDDFVNATLAENKLLKVSNGATPKPPTSPVIDTGGAGKVNTSRMTEALKDASAAFTIQ